MSTPRERVILAGKSTPLTGILTYPTPNAPPASDRPWLILLNAGVLHKMGPNRMTVRLAREAAARGLTSCRFDFASVGDSAARSDGRSLAEGVVVDVREIISHLQRAHRVDRFVVIGLCSGADNALRAAQADERIVGVCMLDPSIHRTRRWYVEHFGPRIVSPRVWRSLLSFRHSRIASMRGAIARRLSGEKSAPAERPELFRTGYTDMTVMEAHLQEVLARRVELFVAFSGGWREIYNYRTQIFDAFPRVQFADKLRLEFYPQAEHTFDLETHRKVLLTDILDWVMSAPFTGARPAPDPAPAVEARAS